MIAARAPVGMLLAGVLVAAAVLLVPATLGTPRPPSDWCVGSIERDSLERHGDGYRMRLRVDFCRPDPDTRVQSRRVLVVAYPRELPSDVCEGSYVYVPGEQYGAAFAAHGFYLAESKYDACLHERCLPDARRSPGCRLDHFYK